MFINLEGPVLTEEIVAEIDHNHYQSRKAGPLLWNSSLPMSKEKTVYNLANNHFMDFGEIGVQHTLNLIQEIGASSVGYGTNAESSRSPLRINVNNRTVSIISACENQFGCATTNNPGVAGFASWIFPTIVREKLFSDFVVVSFHGGAEDYAFPAPFFQDLYRSFIDLGADFVIGHHPHTPQGFESYSDGFIAYGLGNFSVNPKLWNQNPLNLISLGVRINFELDIPTVSIIYYQLRETNEKTEIVEVDGNLKVRLDEYFTALNRVILVREDLELVWKNIAFKLWNEAVADFLNANALAISLKSKIRKTLKYAFNMRKVRKSLSRILDDRRLLTWHAITCESHSQVISTVLNESKGLSPAEINHCSTVSPLFEPTI